MDLSVPDEFIEVVKSVLRGIAPATVLEWLKWASENPDEAKRIAEVYWKLSRVGRSEFETCFMIGNSPVDAAENALEVDREYRADRSLLSKVIAGVRRGGYHINMPNGAKCTIMREEKKYLFRFEAAGETIDVLYHRNFLKEAAKSLLLKGKVYDRGIYEVRYRGKRYHYEDHVFIRAIEENVKPEVLAAAGIGEDESPYS